MGLRSRSSGGYAATSSRASSPVRCLRDSERSWKPSGGWRSEGRHGAGRHGTPAYSSQTKGEPYVDSGPKGGMRYKEKVPSVGTRSPRSSAGELQQHLWRPVSTSVPQNKLEALAADSVSYTRQEKGRMRACIMTQRETGRDTCACEACEADRRAEELVAEGRRCTAGGGGSSSSRSCSARRQRQQQQQQQRRHRRPTSASAASSSAAASSPARSTRSTLSSRAASPPPRHAAYAHAAASAAASATQQTHRSSRVVAAAASAAAAAVDPHPQDGYGERSWDDGRVYEGMWTQGQMEGQGRMRYADGAVYDGAWRDGARCGQGELLDCDGTVTIGVWEAGSLAQTLYTIDAATGVVRRGGAGGGAGTTTTIRVFSKILHAREEEKRREAEEREEEEKRRESQQHQQQQTLTSMSMSMEETQAQAQAHTPPRRTTPPSSAETTPQIADLLPVPSPGSAGVSTVNRLSVGRGGAVVESDLRAMWEVSPSTSPARAHDEQRDRARQRAAASPPPPAHHQHQSAVAGASPDETYLEEFGSEVSVSPTAAYRMRLPRGDGDGDSEHHHHHNRRGGSRSPPRLPHPYVHEEEGGGEAADTLSPKAISPSPRGASPPRRAAAGGGGLVGSSATSVVTFADLPSTGVRGGGAAGYLHQQSLRGGGGGDDDVGLSSSPQWNGSGRPPPQQQQQQQGHAFRSYTSVTAAEYYSRSVHESASAGDAEADRPPRKLLACPMCGVLCLKHWQQRCPQCGVRALAKGVLVDKDNNPIIVAAQ